MWCSQDNFCSSIFCILKVSLCWNWRNVGIWINSTLSVTDSNMFHRNYSFRKAPGWKKRLKIVDCYYLFYFITVEGWMVNSKEGVITQFQRRPPKNTKSDTFQQTLFPQSSRDSLIEVIFCWSTELAFFSLFTKASP